MSETPAKTRSKIMASIHSRNTKPELIVRRYLWNNGFRFRLNHPRLPGRPDIVLRKYKTCIFINGCFWHGHNCLNFRPPKTNIQYWNKKINDNRARDLKVLNSLKDMGWHTITIWECELSKDKREQTLESLIYTLNYIFLLNHNAKYPNIDGEDQTMMAAEP